MNANTFFTKENSKFCLEQVLIVITDGKQTTTKAYTELSVASQGVKNKGVAVYAVGVGKGADAAELREIASSRENVYISESFKELQALAVEIRKKLCDSKFLTLLNAMNSVSVCFKVTVERHFIRLAGSSCLPLLAKSRVRRLQRILFSRFC